MKRLLIALLFTAGIAGCDECKQVTGQCCKTCSGSKPCGDSCIPNNQTCHQGAGCACSGFAEDL